MIWIRGVSDDLIEIEGDIEEEFNTKAGETSILAFSDGTVLNVIYDDLGMWRIFIVAIGKCNLKKVEAISADSNYSDVVRLEGEDIQWVVFGSEIAMRE